jgi:hypothetical protein
MPLRRAICTSLIMFPMVAAFGTVRAQSAAPLPPRRVGITAGINSATAGGKDATNPTPSRLTAFMAGVLLVVPVGPSFAFQPELLYSMKGFKVNESTGTETFKENYIEVPLLARFDIAASGGVKPFFYGGPAVSFKIGCDAAGVSGGVTVSFSCDELESQSGGSTKFKSIDFGAIIGGGLAFDVSGKTFTIGARYDHSLAKITDTDVKHRVISVLATFEFPWR